MKKKIIKMSVIGFLLGICLSCISVYKNSTVMQYKGKAELQTDSLRIQLNNHSINAVESVK